MNWKILYNKLDANLLPNLSKIVRVLCAVENAYFDKLWKNKDNDEMDVESLLSRNFKTNELASIIKGWKKSSLETVQSLCPTYSLDILRQWTIGPYSIELAQQYLSHSKDITFKVHPEFENTFKISKMISRFSKTTIKVPKQYSVIVQLPLKGDIKDIKSYCSCKTGARTLGGCAHATAMIHFLTIPQLQKQSKKKSPTAKSKAESIISVRPFKIAKIEERKAKGLVVDEDPESGVSD